jgi:hypothetical protein
VTPLTALISDKRRNIAKSGIVQPILPSASRPQNLIDQFIFALRIFIEPVLLLYMIAAD